MNSVFVRHCGAMTYWAAGDTEREKLIPTMNDLGLADYVPEQRSDSDALKAAIRDYCKENSTGSEEMPEYLIGLGDTAEQSFSLRVALDKMQDMIACEQYRQQELAVA